MWDLYIVRGLLHAMDARYTSFKLSRKVFLITFFFSNLFDLFDNNNDNKLLEFFFW